MHQSTALQKVHRNSRLHLIDQRHDPNLGEGLHQYFGLLRQVLLRRMEFERAARC